MDKSKSLSTAEFATAAWIAAVVCLIWMLNINFF